MLIVLCCSKDSAHAVLFIVLIKILVKQDRQRFVSAQTTMYFYGTRYGNRHTVRGMPCTLITSLLSNTQIDVQNSKNSKSTNDPFDKQVPNILLCGLSCSKVAYLIYFRGRNS